MPSAPPRPALTSFNHVGLHEATLTCCSWLSVLKVTGTNNPFWQQARYHNGCSATSLTPWYLLAGNDSKPQQVFTALLPHMASICRLQGSSNVTRAGSPFDRETFLRWETFWLCMPKLRQLQWTLPSCSISNDRCNDTVGLPASLQSLQLVFDWTYEVGEDSQFHDLRLSDLEKRDFHRKISSIKTVFHEEDWREHIEPADVSFGQQDWSLLKVLDCTCSSFTGTLHAVNLTVVKLESPWHVQWKAFEACQSLRTIHVTSKRHHCCFDCRGCSFPSTLQHLYLSVEQMLEDGAFQAGHLQLSTMHVSCKTSAGSLDLEAFACGNRKVSIRCDTDGIFDLWMPHQGDIAWRQLDAST